MSHLIENIFKYNTKLIFIHIKHTNKRLQILKSPFLSQIYRHFK